MSSKSQQWQPRARTIDTVRAALSDGIAAVRKISNAMRSEYKARPRGMDVDTFCRKFNKPMLAGYDTGSDAYNSRKQMLSSAKRLTFGEPERKTNSIPAYNVLQSWLSLTPTQQQQALSLILSM